MIPDPQEIGTHPAHPAYSASKAVLHGCTRGVADHGTHGIRYNAVASGWIDTELNVEFLESFTEPEHFKR